MKKYNLLTCVILTAGLFSMTSCNSYKPEGENYFEIDDCYRQIEQKGEKETIEDFQICSYFAYVKSSVVINTDKCHAVYSVWNNCIFTYQSQFINKSGTEAIYKYLNIDIPSKNELTDESTRLNVTGLFTYNDVSVNSEDKGIEFSVDLTQCPNYSTVGLVATSDKYTFTYKDLSKKDGSIVSEGEFSIYINTEIPVTTVFVPYAYQK